MTVIYIDILLALNLFIDFLLLSAVARVMRAPTKRWRLVAAAGIGAVSSLIILLPPMPLLPSLLPKLAFAAIMVLCAYPWAGPGAYVRRTGMLFLMSAVFAGVCWSLWSWLSPTGFYVSNGVVYYAVPPLLLVVLTAAGYGAMWVYDRLTHRAVPRGREYKLVLDTGYGTVTLRTLHDTGCSLCEAFSGRPVALVRTAAIRAILPPDMRRAAEEDVLEASAAVRLIPFESVGGTGLLPAFCPPRATLTAGGITRDVTGTWVAVTEHLGRGEYQALIGNELAVLFNQKIREAETV